MPATDLTADLRTLWRMLCGQPRQGSMAERLQAFYAPQAERYDAFRAGLLHGREELQTQLAIAPGSRVVELGCGTGSSLEFIGEVAGQLASLSMIDLCPALLAVARRRAAGQAQIEVIEADATSWRPDQPVDFVFISYALTMIPQWSEVIDNAQAMLKPGGHLGVVDFHLPADGNRLGNFFWKKWFAHDGVHLSGEHLSQLRQRFDSQFCAERQAAIPYLPGLQAPYYLFVGKRRATPS